MTTKTLFLFLSLFTTGCSTVIVYIGADAGPDSATPPDGGVLEDGATHDDATSPDAFVDIDAGIAPDGSSDPDAAMDVDLGTDPPDLGPDSSSTGTCSLGVFHDGFCYYETTWTGVTVTPRQNCFATGGMPVEWRSFAEQHVLQTYIPGPDTTVGIGLYDNNPPHGDWRWLSDMSSAAVDWLAFPAAGEQPALTGAGAIGVSSTPMYTFCVRPAS